MVRKIMVDFISNNSSTTSFPVEIPSSYNNYSEASWPQQMNYSNNINSTNFNYTNMQLNAIREADAIEPNHFFDHLQNWSFRESTANNYNYNYDYDYNSSSTASTSAASSASSFMAAPNLNVDLRPPVFGIASTSETKKEIVDYSNSKIYENNSTSSFSYLSSSKFCANKELWSHKENNSNE